MVKLYVTYYFRWIPDLLAQKAFKIVHTYDTHVTIGCWAALSVMDTLLRDFIQMNNFDLVDNIIVRTHTNAHQTRYYQWCTRGDEPVIIPSAQRNLKGFYWSHLVRPSVCPSVDRIGIMSALYLLQYSSFQYIRTLSSNLRRHVAWKRFLFVFQNLKFWQIL